MGYPVSCFWRSLPLAWSEKPECWNRKPLTGAESDSESKGYETQRPGLLKCHANSILPFSAVSTVAPLGSPELRERRKENFSRGFRLFIAQYHASLEGAVSWDEGNSRQNGINMYAKPNRISTAVVSWVRSSLWFYGLEWSSIDDCVDFATIRVIRYLFLTEGGIYT